MANGRKEMYFRDGELAYDYSVDFEVSRNRSPKAKIGWSAPIYALLDLVLLTTPTTQIFTKFLEIKHVYLIRPTQSDRNGCGLRFWRL
jgi:hypothetical protein